MAQVVKWWEYVDNFLEGPFVICDVHGWRIMVHKKNSDQNDKYNTVLPHQNVLMLANYRSINRFGEKNHAAQVCDQLNQLVKSGQIVESNGQWNVRS